MKKVNLVWYAFREDFNSHNLERFNVLSGYEEEIKKRIKREKITTREQFKESIRIMLMSRFWGRAEYEVLVSGLFTRDEDKYVFKIDVWYQLEPNLDLIVDYIIKEMKLKID